ncbi:bifunctional folylpolyglutamate synthase/dihydrofolate synthase [Deinococcus yavapaiensis]|uniref:tetrahydrofolate synthase n=1 Tax=Deinococcus yavapaiensis KR-236 TaxID=694435 RepID=A0A318SMD1_9DEIO|nr:cyanophycin synthetase [Deinococcus yavapaiensis]PYE53630.1 dihydrofolate synthase/folylpolyglutamate synthase [Deinococcus yavapaiensis KR-236]
MQSVYDWLFTRTRGGQQRGPERADDLLACLGQPDRAFRSVRVVGTNGKGSTAAMLEAGLTAAGETVGCFTSPHLEAFEERVRVNGRDISARRTAEFVDWAKEHAPHAPFFELTLGLACATFRDEGVTTAVMEAGVGGASDATQALRNVAAVLLTNVAVDHVLTLGPTTRDIALDKAAAALEGVPFLTTATGEGLEVALHVASQRGAIVYTPSTHPDLFHLPRLPRLAGEYQRCNARLALATLRLLRRDAGIEAALDATHKGRLERFDVDGRTVLLDGAHNPHAANALADSLGSVDTLVFGVMSRKDVADTLAPLRRIARHVVFTTPGEGGTDPAALASFHDGTAAPDPRAALALALRATPPGGRVLVAGSLYLAGTLRGALTSVPRTSLTAQRS